MATSSQYGAFVPTNWIWDIQQLEDIDDISPELKELLVRLYQNLNLMANVLNVKITGQYALMETVDGALWFPNPANNSSTPTAPAERQELRKTFIIVGPLPNAGATTIPHGITVNAGTSWTFIQGTATKPSGDGVSLNSSSATISTTSNNIVITTTVDLSAYTLTYIVLSYLQT